MHTTVQWPQTQKKKKRKKKTTYGLATVVTCPEPDRANLEWTAQKGQGKAVH